MISLKISKDEMKKKEKEMTLAVSSSDGERYPYGTRIELNNESLDKMGIKELPAAGTKMMIEAKVTVIASRQSVSNERTTRSVEFQITDMDLESDEDEVSEGELTRKESGAMGAVAKKMRDM